MAETWFRGQSTMAPPSVKGGSIHDFGEGLYLTNRSDVARIYADTRVQHSGGKPQVLSVKTRPGELGRILDLRTNRKWQKFLTTPTIPKQSTSTPLAYIKASNENYGRFFKIFIQQNKINLDRYDGIIGRELVRGGDQLCISHKNGKLSSIARRIRARLRPLPPRWTGGGVVVHPRRNGSARTARSAIRGRIIPRVNFRSAGRSMGAGIAGALAQMAMGWLKTRVESSLIDHQIEKLAPRIAQKSAEPAAMLEALSIDYGGGVPYANITLEISNRILTDPMFPSIETADTPFVSLESVTVSKRNFTGEGATETDYHTLGKEVKTFHHFSVRMDLPNDKKLIYAEYREVITWYDARIRRPPAGWSGREIISLHLDRAALMAESCRALLGR